MQLIIANRNYSSWSLRGWLAAKASGVALEVIRIPLCQADTRERILAWSPSGKVPCLIDNGQAIWDSLAIAEYLAEDHLHLWPEDARARAEARSVSAEMHSGFQALRTHMPMNIRKDYDGKGRLSEVMRDIARIEAIWNRCREQYGYGGPYLFGHYSIADMMFAPVCLRFETYAVRLEGPAQPYLQTMLAHPHVLEWKCAALAEDERIPEYDIYG